MMITLAFAIDIIDSMAQEHFEQLHDDALETVLTNRIGCKNQGGEPSTPHGTLEDHHAVPPSDDVAEMVAALESLPKQYGKPQIPISDSISTNKLLPSVIQPPFLGLKPLPGHLKYVFLGDHETLTVIISSSLTAQEEDRLVRVLR